MPLNKIWPGRLSTVLNLRRSRAKHFKRPKVQHEASMVAIEQLYCINRFAMLTLRSVGFGSCAKQRRRNIHRFVLDAQVQFFSFMEVNTSSQGLSAFEKKVLQPLKEDLLNGVKATLIHSSQATKLFRYVKKSKRLRSLDCTGTCVDDSMAKLIGEAIHECPTLNYLALRHTKLSPKGLLSTLLIFVLNNFE
jgi:hypothetical protein